MLNRLVFDTLISVDAGGRAVPILANAVPSVANGGISPDGLQITYHLRHGVRWHDGALFSSHDVAWTWGAIMDPRNNVASHTGFAEVRTVATPDPYTVVFQLKHRFAPAIHALFGESDAPYPILPAHLLEHEPDLNRAAFNAAPIGTGAFRFVHWRRGEELEYTANHEYFRGRPRLERIIVKNIPDENTELAALQAHEIDWFFEPSPRIYAQLQHQPGIITSLIQTNQFAGMIINTERPLLRELPLRQAISEAIDKQALADHYTYGSAVVADQDLPPWLWASPPHNPQRSSLIDAQAKLRTAGFTPGADGILVRGKERLAFTLSYAEGNATNRLIAIALQARLRLVGIELTIHSYLPSLLFAPAGMGGILARGSYDLNLSGWVSGVDPDNSTQFLCSERPPTGSNVSRFCDSKMDAAQRLALSSYDQATRKAAYARIEQRLSDEVPEVFFYYPRGIQAYSSTFTGFTPNAVTESWNAFQWTISSPTTRQ